MNYHHLKAAQKDAKLADIYEETKLKYGLNSSDVAVGHGIIQDFSKIDLPTASLYSDALTKIDSKIGRANLRRIGNDSRFKNLVLANNGDVVTSLNKFVKTQAGKEALTELGMFIVLTEVLKEPEVALWLNNQINAIKHTLKPTIQTTIQNDGYEWKATKEIFLSDGSVKDNTLLFNAYNKGWRPWSKDVKTPTQSDIEKSRKWLYDNPEFQTDSFKNWVKTMVDEIGKQSLSGKEVSKVEMTPADPKDRKENVRYVDNKEEMDALNGVDDGKDGRDVLKRLKNELDSDIKK